MLDASDWIENGVILKEYSFCSLKVLWSQNILLGEKKKNKFSKLSSLKNPVIK